MGLKEAILEEVERRGVKQGIEQGKRSAIEHMVIRASKRGMVIPDICELFDLPESEVKAIPGTIDTE